MLPKQVDVAIILAGGGAAIRGVDAANEGWQCYHSYVAVLPWKHNNVIIDGRRHCHRWSAVLPTCIDMLPVVLPTMVGEIPSDLRTMGTLVL